MSVLKPVAMVDENIIDDAILLLVMHKYVVTCH